jgi:hypothetical protein
MHDAPAVDAGLPVADDGTAGARIERFPGAGDPVPPPDDAADHAQRAVDPGLPSLPTADATFDPSHPWAPFESEADFLLARYMVDFGISETAMDHLLKTLLPALGVHHAVRSVYAVKQRVDQMRDGLGHWSWRRETTEMRWNDPHPEPIAYYSRDILQCARWLLRQTAYENHLAYAPERHFKDDGGRVYTAMHTADWWWDQQVCPRLPPRGKCHADRASVYTTHGGYHCPPDLHVRRHPPD